MVSYSPAADLAVPRLRRLYEERDQSLVLAVMRIPQPSLKEFARIHPAGFCPYPDPVERSAFWEGFLRERREVLDDSIASVYLSEMDQGLYGGLIGGEVQFMSDPETGWISSMVKPVLPDLSGVDDLAFDPQHPWFTRYERHLRTYAQAARDRFGLCQLILINHLNFVFELVGATNTYLAVLDEPERVERAMELAFTICRGVMRTFFSVAGAIAGGTCLYGQQWVPGRIVSESVDPFHMAGPDYFEIWGRPALERMFAEFDGGVTHIHGNGRHLLEGVSTVRGLKAVWLGDDTGYPQAFDVLPQIRSRVGDLPLALSVGYQEFRSALAGHGLTGGVLYDVQGVPDVDTANDLMEQVRAHRA